AATLHGTGSHVEPSPHPCPLLLPPRRNNQRRLPTLHRLPEQHELHPHGSVFEANLDALLSSLHTAAAAASSGFAENATTVTKPPDQAFGLAQCRAEASAPAAVLPRVPRRFGAGHGRQVPRHLAARAAYASPVNLFGAQSKQVRAI
ncbi:unnamed protein product, partial [Urochloa humidicola]